MLRFFEKMGNFFCGLGAVDANKNKGEASESESDSEHYDFRGRFEKAETSFYKERLYDVEIRRRKAAINSIEPDSSGIEAEYAKLYKKLFFDYGFDFRTTDYLIFDYLVSKLKFSADDAERVIQNMSPSNYAVDDAGYGHEIRMAFVRDGKLVMPNEMQNVRAILE